MLGKYYPHVGQILPTCWANTVHMLGRFRPLLDTMVCLVLHKRLHFILSSRTVDPLKYLPALKRSIVTVNFKVLKKESNQFCTIDGKDSKEGR